VRVLFVDDDERVLESLRARLRGHRHRWGMRFCSDPRVALNELQREPADVLVTDLRMPSLGGASLLVVVQAWYPEMRRIVLSGHVDGRWAQRLDAVADVVLRKPCDIAALERAIAASTLPA
jgi:DNA-binding NtrC family response regulator